MFVRVKMLIYKILSMKTFGYWHNYENCRLAASTCLSKSEFHGKFRAAYRASKQEGWFDKLEKEFWSYDGWTLTMCQTEAMKFSNMREFYTYSRNAYKAADKHGWLDKICLHMPSTLRYWTYNRIKEEIERKGYKTKKEFKINNSIAYNAAYKNGWLDELCQGMKVLRRKKFSKKECILVAKSYKYIVDFEKADQAIYNAARKNGWLDEVCAHMHHRVKEWTNELLACEAKKYKHRIDFLRTCPSAYTIAARKGILDEICSHMDDLGDMYERAIYAWEFPNKAVYVGLTCNLDRREEQHITDVNSPVYKYRVKTGLTPKYIVKYNYVPVSEAKRLEGEVLAEYINQGWKKLNSCKTGGIGALKVIYSEDFVRKLLKTCKTREEFRISYPAAYSACSKRKLMYIIDEFFPKITRIDKSGNVHHPHYRKWDDCKIWNEVKKYKSCTELLNNNRNAYRAAYKWGLLEKVKEYYNNLL